MSVFGVGKDIFAELAKDLVVVGWFGEVGVGVRLIDSKGEEIMGYKSLVISGVRGT